MPELAFATVQLGDEVPPLTVPAVTRQMLALYAGASGDTNPIHIDLDFARGAGMDDVFAQGMLSMAYLGRMLTAWAPQQRLREFGARFTAITRVGEQLTCRGTVVEKTVLAGQQLVTLDLVVINASGEAKIRGQAKVCLS